MQDSTGDHVALSPMQLQIWMADRLAPHGRLYAIPAAVDLSGPLHPEALEAALALLVQRHDILRMVLREHEGRAEARIADAAFVLDRADVAGSAAPAAVADRLTARFANRPFDIERPAPLFRALLIRLGEREHRLILLAHHTVADGVSMGLVLEELCDLYQRLLQGDPIAVTAEGPQYRDVAEQIRSDGADAGLAWWRSYLDGAPAGVRPPTDFARPQRPGHVGAHRRLVLDGDVRDRLATFASERGRSAFTLLFSVFRIWSHRLSGADDLLIGIPFANRSRLPHSARVLGPMVNTLPFRSRLATTDFDGLMADTAASTAAILAHQHVAADAVAGLLPSPPGTTPWSVMFNQLQDPTSTTAMPGIAITPVRVETASAKADLMLSVTESADRVELDLEYDTELFDHGTGDALLEEYARLLRDTLGCGTVEGAPNPPTRAAPRPDPLPPTGTLAERWRESAREHRDRPALTWGGTHRTYGELAERVEALAATLAGRGVGLGDRVVLRVDRGPAQIEAILAVLLAGAAYVPIDHRSPQERVDLIIKDTGAPVTLESDPDGEIRLVANADPGARTGPPMLAPDDIAYVIYTSGSTGRPKGVEVTHRNVLRLFSATEQYFGFDRDDVWTMFHSYAFDVSVWELWGALLHGGRLVLPSDEDVLSPDRFRGLLVDQRVTVLCQTPGVFRFQAETDADRPDDALALRYVIFAGEPLDLHMLRSWFARHDDERPRMVNMYGITETCVHATYRRITAADLDRGAVAPVGEPFPDVDLHLLDADLRPVPQGFPGEIHIGGPAVTRGYAERPALTAQRYLPDPFGAPGSRLYRSGDLGRRRADGDLECWGRIDSQVKLRGFRVELGEVEAALCEHPDVDQAVAAVKDQRLCAYLVSTRTDLDTAELRAHCARTLPEYEVPAVFMRIDALPVTVNGKIDRAALPDPRERQAATETAPAAPAGRSEPLVLNTVLDAWRTVLGLDRVAPDDDFFALGGNSMTAVELVARLREAGVAVDVFDVFQARTPDALASGARRVATAFTGVAPFALIADADRALLPDTAVDAYPLTALQTGMVYESSLCPETEIYHNITSLELRGACDPESMRRALERVVARHDVLRTGIDLHRYSEPLQIVHAEVPLPITIRDLRSDPEWRESVRQDLREEHLRRFDIADAPLFRVVVHLLPDEHFRFTFSEHHAILDGWSLAAVCGELLTALADTDRPEPPRTAGRVRFADYVRLETEAIASGADRVHWQRETSGFRPRSVADRPGEARPEVRTLNIDLPLEESLRLRELADAGGLPLKSVTAALHYAVLGAYWRTEAPLGGMLFNGRPEDPGGHQTAGLFLNALPVGAQLHDQTWLELAEQLLTTERRAMQHRRLPLPHVIEATGGRPLFDVLFNYMEFPSLAGQAATVGFARGRESEMASEKTGYALVANLSANHASNDLGIMLAWDRSRISPRHLDVLESLYRQAAARFAAAPDRPAALTAPPMPALVDAPTALAVHRPRTVPSAAAGATEAELTELWRDALGHGDFGRTDHFYDVGGHSLLALRVIGRLRRRFAVDPDVRELLEHFTIADWAALIDRDRR